ncbi:MAG: SWIM zinc finger family protein, partial [bacterium]|nr:SWIM zinc finger family protein [bacterium]
MAFWAPYVPVAKRRAKAQREMNKLRKKGQDIQPIAIEGRTIARSFWGKGWCDHLESFSDFANRLPRGRTYVRNGSVCHLGIHPGRVDAMVSGSELYNVTIRINELKTATWESIKTKCSGQIGSVLELIQGKLSNQVMGIVADRDQGLFPKPSEIKLSCSCPDWATMCKHVAAVLYGVGSRLDDRPELLFLLREVDAAELIATEMALPDTAATGDSLADDQLGDIFGIDLDMEIKAPPALQVKIKQSKAKKQRRQRAAIAPQRQPSPVTKTRRMVTSGTPASRARNATSSASRRTTASRSATPQPRATAKRAT